MLESGAKKLRIGISTHDFLHLSGSLDLLRLMIRGLKIKKSEHQLFLLIDPVPEQLKHLQSNHLISSIEKRLPVPSLLKRILHKMERSIRKGMVKLSLLTGDKSIVNIIESIGPELLTDVKILIYEGFQKGIVKTAKKFHIDIIIPTTFNLPIPFVSYLCDFQHKYFPENFQPQEIEQRDKFLMDLISFSDSMIVTSQNSKRDMQRFYNASNDKITVLPIASYLKDDIYLNSIEIYRKYNLPDKYFVICSQFLTQESLETASQALRIMIDQNIVDCHIVFIDRMNDTRHPYDASDFLKWIKQMDLSDHTTFLGNIPKRDQLEIMKGATAVIQTTTFKVATVGGSVCEAIALGVPAIAADIPINQELLSNENLTLFKGENSAELAKKMMAYWENPVNRPDPQVLIEQANNRMVDFSDCLYSAIEKALISGNNQQTTDSHDKSFHQRNRPGLKQLKFNNGDISIQIPMPKRDLITSCFAFSLHKAGSSLLTNMLYEYLQLNDISFIDLPQRIAEMDLDIDQLKNDSVNQASFESGYCFLGWRHLPPLLQYHNFSNTKNLLLVRDPRDRLVSLYFSILKSHYVPPNGTIRDALIGRRKETSNLSIDEFAIGFIPELIKQWNQYHQFLDWRTTKIYRYEDVIFRKTEWLIDIINYFGLSYNQEIIERIAAKNDIRPNIERPDKHIRQVNPGNYKVHLKKETIHLINQRLDPFLRQYDYFKPDRFGTELVYAIEGEKVLNVLKPIVQK